MAGLKIHNGEWVVVCDGGKALILENAGDTVFPDLRQAGLDDLVRRSCRELARARSR